MAGDWLKVEKDTPEKPEVLAIAARLGMDPDIVFAKCFKLWRWFDSNTADGNAASVTAMLLDNLVHSPGFCDALREVGWLQVRGSSLAIPNFSRHMGQSGKKRALTANRVAEHRARKCNAESVTEALPEKRREEKNKAPPFPPALETPDFHAAWERWLLYRKELHKPLTASTVKAQLKKLAPFGAARAVQLIERAICKGWQGIVFEEDEPPDRNGHQAALFPETEEARAARVTEDRRQHEEQLERARNCKPREKPP